MTAFAETRFPIARLSAEPAPATGPFSYPAATLDTF
jgi:hypothetical protein